MAIPFEAPGPSPVRVNTLGGVTQRVSADARVESVIEVRGVALAVISVGGQTFNMPLSGEQVGEMHRLKGLSVTLTIAPTQFATGVTGMGKHLFDRQNMGARTRD